MSATRPLPGWFALAGGINGPPSARFTPNCENRRATLIPAEARTRSNSPMPRRASSAIASARRFASPETSGATAPRRAGSALERAASAGGVSTVPASATGSGRDASHSESVCSRPRSLASVDASSPRRVSAWPASAVSRSSAVARSRLVLANRSRSFATSSCRSMFALSARARADCSTPTSRT